MLNTYQVFSQEMDLEGKRVIQYGILCKSDLQTVVDSIEQITTTRRLAEKIAQLLNSEQVAPVHFADVIDDFLADPDDYIWR